MSEIIEQSTELAPRQTGAIQTTPNNPIGQMLQQITAGGVTPESVAALDRMTELYLKVEGVNARKAFIEAKAALQADLPLIQATKPVPNNDGTIRYKFAPYEEIMRKVAPVLVKHGFSISFSQEVGDGRITAICTLSHIGGHEEKNHFAVRAGGKGPPGSSDAQADGAASTYAKRFALCNCLNITIGLDDDGRMQGDLITAQQAESLERRLKAVHGNMAGFLRLAEADSFADIRTAKYAMLDAALSKKEAEAKRQQAAQHAEAEHEQPAGQHGSENPPPLKPVSDEEVVSYAVFYAACEAIIAGDWSSEEFTAAMNRLGVDHPIKVNDRKGLAARRMVLTAWRAGKVSKEGKVTT